MEVHISHAKQAGHKIFELYKNMPLFDVNPEVLSGLTLIWFVLLLKTETKTKKTLR